MPPATASDCQTLSWSGLIPGNEAEQGIDGYGGKVLAVVTLGRYNPLKCSGVR